MARQATLNVSLTTQLRDFVQRRVRSGQYESASEVIREGLRALRERERATSAFWDDVRAKVEIGKREARRGDVVDGEAAMDAILAELDDETLAKPAPRKRSGARR